MVRLPVLADGRAPGAPAVFSPGEIPGGGGALSAVFGKPPPVDPAAVPVNGLSPGHLADRFARRVRYLRVSVTDRCNYGCVYCRPETGLDFRPRHELLT